MLEGCIDEEERQQLKQLNYEIFQAWHIAKYVWAKELPDLQDVLIKDKDNTEESQPVDLEQKCMLAFAKAGIKIVDEGGGS